MPAYHLALQHVHERPPQLAPPLLLVLERARGLALELLLGRPLIRLQLGLAPPPRWQLLLLCRPRHPLCTTSPSSRVKMHCGSLFSVDVHPGPLQEQPYALLLRGMCWWEHAPAAHA